MLAIRQAIADDRSFWLGVDSHASPADFERWVACGHGYVLLEGDKPIGLMRYTPFWIGMPYLTLLYLLEPYRGLGYGRAAMRRWEDDMRRMGGEAALTSTQADEQAQHFYRKLGYTDCGCLLINDGPFKQPPELFMLKALRED